MPRHATTKEARIKPPTHHSQPTKNLEELTAPPFCRECRVWNSRDGITSLFRFGAEATGRDPSESFGCFEPIKSRVLGIIVSESRARVFRVQLRRV